MTILFDGTRPVKTNRPFGVGIAPASRERRAPYTAADLAWAAAHLNANATDYDVLIPAPTDRELEDGAEQAMWNDLMDRGFRPY